MTNDYPAKLTFQVVENSIQQAEQINGYFLISLQIEEKPDLFALLGRLFALSSTESAKNTDSSLALFQMPSAFNPHYQFLSRTALEMPATASTLLEIDAVQSLDKSLSAILLEIPSVVIAKEDYLANAFAIAKFRQTYTQETLFFLQAEIFPFMPKPARFWSPEMPDEAIAASSLLEDWGMVNRLASESFNAGCYQGSAQQLFDAWQQKANKPQTWQSIVLLNE